MTIASTPAADRAADRGPAPEQPWCAAHETHSGAVFLLGDLAYKFKKPVKLDFLDFSDTVKRRAVCEREVLLNRRLAPDVYLGVAELTGPGAPPEPAVVMRRLPDHLRLSHLLRDGHPICEETARIARLVAVFHAGAETGPEISRAGTRDALRARWDANLEQMPADGSVVDRATLAEIAALVHEFLDGREELFDERIRRGAIVDGHGDLTPDDIFCLPDGPRLLDCLEFDDALRHVDRLDDIAFLAMGLEELGAAEAARTLVATWADAVGDTAPPALVHHFIAYRAFVRAKVGCLSGAQHHGPGTAMIGRYVDLTRTHLRAGAVKLVLIGGPPASGKSTMAGAVADRLGMTSLSSDRIRKELAGLDPVASAASAFGTGIYSEESTRATYATLLERAGQFLALGESVVLDATWTTASERAAAAAVAERGRADLVELRCHVDEQTVRERLRTRKSLSDADESVATLLRDAASPWASSHEIDTRLPLAECVERACGLIRPDGAGRPT